MKQYVIIGLGSFGTAMATELSKLPVELIVIDRDPQRIDLWKDRVDVAYVADALDKKTLKQMIPEVVQAIVIDLPESSDASFLVTHYLSKLGYLNIMVQANSLEHGEIAMALGATKVVYPHREAARRLVPSLINHGLLSYTPMGKNLAFAEIPVPHDLVGMRVGDAQFRARYKLNIVAVRLDVPDSDETKEDEIDESLEDMDTIEWMSVHVDHVFTATSILLVSGDVESLQAYAQQGEGSKQGEGGFLARFIGSGKKRGKTSER